MNRRQLVNIARQSIIVGGHLEKHGPQLLQAAYDWQSPLRTAAGPGPKGDHSDPTFGNAINPDQNALVYRTYLALLAAKNRADLDLAAFHIRHDPLSEAQIQRGRTSSVPPCIDCHGPAIPMRSGRCDRCRKRWERAGRPTQTVSARLYAVELEQATVVVHEHEETA